jgi:MarR family transcriptional repressor of emrRAB
MPDAVNPRLVNLLAALTLGLHDDTTAALEAASGLTGSGTAALLALEEFLGGAPVGRLAEVLGLTHSGAVRLLQLLQRRGLVARRPGADRRRVEVELTARGRSIAAAARTARAEVLGETVGDLDPEDAAQLEVLLDRLVRSLVRARVGRRAAGDGSAWLCRSCDFGDCGRPEGRCPAQVTAATLTNP